MPFAAKTLCFCHTKAPLHARGKRRRSYPKRNARHKLVKSEHMPHPPTQGTQTERPHRRNAADKPVVGQSFTATTRLNKATARFILRRFAANTTHTRKSQTPPITMALSSKKAFRTPRKAFSLYYVLLLECVCRSRQKNFVCRS